MKRKENKITINNLIYALLFLLLGVMLLTSTEDLISIISKVIGIVLITLGIIKSIIYVYMKGKEGNYNISQLVIGLLVIGCGIILLMYSGALSFAIRIIVGLWVLFAGINRIILAISVKTVDKTGFKVYLTTSIFMIVIGLFLISGLFDKIIGLFIIIYSITEIVNYIYFKSRSKNDELTIKKKKSNFKSNKKTKVVDAIVEE